MTGMRMLDHWSPPDGAGDAVACLATTFTFSSDFFMQDCLSRFLQLSTVSDEGDPISVIAALIEEEDRLNDAQVTVLIDRSSPAEKRNLRWDILPVGITGGLLHAKVAILMWERATRMILGSANLTEAGYRRQVEAAVAFDLNDECAIPGAVVNDISSELRSYVLRSSGPSGGPKGRGIATLDLFDERAAAMGLGTGRTGGVHFSVAPSSPGTSPLDHLEDVWRGSRPLRATVLSPFWDGRVEDSALVAIGDLLTGRPASARSLTAVLARDQMTGVIRAPKALGQYDDVRLVSFDPPDDEIRRLHAKIILVESDDWLAALIGSSNATRFGLGLDKQRGHAELNLWVGCSAGSSLAAQLRALVRLGEPIDIRDDTAFEPEPDEDDAQNVELPYGFEWATIDAATSTVEVSLDASALPPTWQVAVPTGFQILNSSSWEQGDRPTRVKLKDGDPLPPYLIVKWTDANGGEHEATWPANVEDRAALPLPSELAALPVEVMLIALASSRPLPVAVERELRRRAAVPGSDSLDVILDPLQRYDNSQTLLRRTRRWSLALWRLSERLARPAATTNVVRWRLHGPVGPLSIADGLVDADRHRRLFPGESHFLLAELTLAVHGVDWSRVIGMEHQDIVKREVQQLIRELGDRLGELGPADDEGLERYVLSAFERATA